MKCGYWASTHSPGMDIAFVEYEVHEGLQECTRCTGGYSNVLDVQEATGMGSSHPSENSQSKVES